MTTTEATLSFIPTGSLLDRLRTVAFAVRETTALRCLDSAVELLTEHGEPEIAARLHGRRTADPGLARNLILSAGLETVFRTEEARTDSDVADPAMR